MKPPFWCIQSLGTVVWCVLGWSGRCELSAAQPGGLLQVSTFAGGGPFMADGTGRAAGFDEPGGIAVDRLGYVYVSDTDRDNGMGNTIRKITPSGVVTTLAGDGVMGYADGIGRAARFSVPEALAVDGSGNIYVADSHNHCIRKITSAGLVTTLAGAGRFFYPLGVAVDGSGNVFVADTYNHAIRRITPDGVVTTVAGAVGSLGSADGVGDVARFNYPQHVCVDDAGNIYVSDSGNSTVRKIARGGVVTTLAGTAGAFGSDDGVGRAARFARFSPSGLASDSSGSIYVADANNHTIRRISTSGEVTTVAGMAGLSGIDDGTGKVARFFYPVGLAVDRAGKVYVAEMGNNLIRVGVPMAPPRFLVQPVSQTIASETTVVFTAEAAASPTYQWQKEGENITGATNAMLVITRATEINAGAYSCVAINSSGTATSSAATLAVVSTMNAGRLVNLSVRAITGAEGQTPIVGFVIGGPGTSGSQNLLIRAAGPTLNGLGATGVLADPILTVLQGGAVVAANDNWGTPASNQSAVLAAVSATGAFQFSSASSLDAALVANLPSVTGGYTAEITGAGRGVTLAEVYDNTALYAATTPRLINLSARTQVGAGVGDLIAGFVIGGSTSKTVLIRAVGPALVSRGVTTALPDPQVALHAMINGQDMALATNAGWGGDAQISVVGNSVGAFPLANGSTADSALLLSLPPGAYTVHVSSVSGDTGIALAEIYEVP